MDVTIVVYYMLTDMGLADQLSLRKYELAALLLAAIGHDVLHPGKNNLFQANSKSDAAKLYNNDSILENLSKDFTRKMLVKTNFVHLLNLKEDGIQAETLTEQVLKIVDDLILKTDMVHHFSLLEFLVDLAEEQGDAGKHSRTSSLGSRELKNLSVISSASSINSNSPIRKMCPNSLENLKSQKSMEFKYKASESSSICSANSLLKIEIAQQKDRQQILNSILHAAARTFERSKKWSDLIQLEFRNQRDEEIDLQLPVTVILDSQPKSQLAFTDIIVRPYFDALNDLFPRILNMVDLISSTSRQWELLLAFEQVKTTEDEEQKVIMRKRASADVEQLRPINTDKNTVRSRSATNPNRNSVNRLSIAAGAIELPSPVEKYLNSINIQETRSTLNQNGKRRSIARVMAKVARSGTINFNDAVLSEVDEELQGFPCSKSIPSILE